ncbi:hypothetical protein [Microcoleus sp. BROC3]|uniref:hypothetical protein n=1 Tax=Microcoleus sp. BROC3 TaxID=3055323 RepID=UPI002FD75283
MILQLLKALMRSPEGQEIKYWHNGYFVRIFKEEYGTGWQIYRDDKFTYQNGQFVDLIDGGVAESDAEAYRSAEEYIENCLRFQRGN